MSFDKMCAAFDGARLVRFDIDRRLIYVWKGENTVMIVDARTGIDTDVFTYFTDDDSKPAVERIDSLVLRRIWEDEA